MEILIGFLVSIATQFVKAITKRFSISSYWVVASLSLAGAGLYVALSQFGYWELTARVLIVAAGFHNVLLRPFEKK